MNKLFIQITISLLIVLNFALAEDSIPYCPKELTPYTSSKYIPTCGNCTIKLKVTGWARVPNKGKKIDCIYKHIEQSKFLPNNMLHRYRIMILKRSTYRGRGKL